jgi:hypothetical protein
MRQDPDKLLLGILQETYAAAAELANLDRKALEREGAPHDKSVMPQNRERLPSEPLRAIGSRVLSRESHNTRSMNRMAGGLRPEDDPIACSQEADSAQAGGRVDPVATSDPVFFTKPGGKPMLRSSLPSHSQAPWRQA